MLLFLISVSCATANPPSRLPTTEQNEPVSNSQVPVDSELQAQGERDAKLHKESNECFLSAAEALDAYRDGTDSAVVVQNGITKLEEYINYWTFHFRRTQVVLNATDSGSRIARVMDHEDTDPVSVYAGFAIDCHTSLILALAETALAKGDLNLADLEYHHLLEFYRGVPGDVIEEAKEKALVGIDKVSAAR